MGVFGGMSGLNCVEVFDAGAQGLIPSCELTSIWLGVYKAHSSGNRDQALEDYRRVVPLLAFMTQSLDFGIACGKELLRRQGVLSSAAIRGPSPLHAWSLKVLGEHARAAGLPGP